MAGYWTAVFKNLSARDPYERRFTVYKIFGTLASIGVLIASLWPGRKSVKIVILYFIMKAKRSELNPFTSSQPAALYSLY